MGVRGGGGRGGVMGGSGSKVREEGNVDEECLRRTL